MYSAHFVFHNLSKTKQATVYFLILTCGMRFVVLLFLTLKGVYVVTLKKE